MVGMKPRRNTADSEPNPGTSHTSTSTSTSNSTSKPNTLKKSKGNSLEMDAWSHRYTPLQSQAPDTPSAAQLKPLELRPQSQIQLHSQSQSQPQTPLSPHSQYYQQYLQHQQSQQSQSHHDSWRGSQNTFQPPPSQRASAASSQDGNGKHTSRRGSRNSRTAATPTHISAVDFTTDFSDGLDGQDLFYPLSPAPVKKPELAKGPRTTHGDDSEILPPDDRNYPVLPFRTASGSTLASQTQRNSLGKKNSHSGVTVPAPTAVPLRIIHTSPTGPPSIYWSDDNASQAGTDSATIRTAATNPSAFTFYREPDDDSDGEDDTDARRQNRASRRLNRLSRLSRITSSTRDERSDNDKGKDKDRSEKRRSFREMGLAVARGITNDFKEKENDKENENDKGTTENPTCKGDRCDLDELDSDDDLEDGVDADGRRLEGRQTAEFEFVNGRYVPPALRNGRAPGRKPVNESRELERERERKRRLNMSGALGVARSAASPDTDPELGGDGDAGRDIYDEDGVRPAQPFWFVAGIIVFFTVAIAVGVGVGVGLPLSRN